MVSEAGLGVTVVFSPAPRQIQEIKLQLALPCTVLHALQQSRVLVNHPELDLNHLLVGVWGRKTSLNHLLRDQDRVELYRPLQVDPKVARRERFRKQGARSAGLFVKKRAGAKAGY